MKKRILSLLISVSVILTFAFTVFAEKEENEFTLKGALFTNDDSAVDVSVSFDFDWLTEESNTVFNSSLAKFSSVASFDAYYREKDEGTSNENKAILKDSGEAYACTSFLTSFGFENVRRIETYDKTSTDIDKNDSATFMAGHKSINGKDVFVFVFRGAFSSGEWLSVFDVGDPDAIDEHPNWTNPEHLKSIDVAANAAKVRINDYIKEVGTDDEPDCILFTGHSRGGAIANVLGAEYENTDGVQSYTYTFAAPKITLAENAAEYKTIFNIINEDDFFADFLPFENEHLNRYGIEVSDSFSDNTELTSLLGSFGAIGEYSCMSEEDRTAYREIFKKYFKNRTDIFEKSNETFTFDTEEAASEKLNAFNTVISGFKLDDLCSAVQDGCSVTLTTAKASQLKAYSMVLAYATPDMVDYVKTLFPDDEIADLLYKDLAGITNAHRILKSFVLSGYAKPESSSETSETDESSEESSADESSDLPAESETSAVPPAGDNVSKLAFFGLFALIAVFAAITIKRRKSFEI